MIGGLRRNNLWICRIFDAVAVEWKPLEVPWRQSVTQRQILIGSVWNNKLMICGLVGLFLANRGTQLFQD
jgi:hypothetical protein